MDLKKVYLDHSATTPLDPVVLKVMMPFLENKFGNPSSIHSFGRAVKVALEESREAVAQSINAKATEIFFTSGGTEADNMAIKGAALLMKQKGNHIITSKIEHHAVLHSCEYLEKNGFGVTYVLPDQYGMIHPEAVAEAITDKTILISIMHANNEVGTINPIEKIGEIAREKKIVFHTDAVQSLGKVKIDLSKLPVDLLSFAGHKIYGPKGIGGLYVRKGIQLEKLLHGGGHERNRRAGTENIPGIIGIAKAIEIAIARMEQDHHHIHQLTASLYNRIKQEIPNTILNGHPTERIIGNLNLSFKGVEGESLLLSLDLKGIAASSGSACTSGSIDPSHVLLAMKVKAELAQSSIRFSLGRGNTAADIDYVMNHLPAIVNRLRSISPLS